MLSVFDLDRTLIQKNVSFAFGSFLYRVGKLDFFKALYCTGAYVRYKFVQPSIRTLHQKVLGSFLKGFSLSVLQKEVENFLNLQFEAMLYPPAIERLEAAKRRGDHVLLLSGSPNFLVGPVADRLGVEHWDATRYTVDNNDQLYTIDAFMEGEKKVEQTRHWARQLNLTPQEIHAFSDSMEDLRLLELAGGPVGVRPERRLKSICEYRGWEII